MREAYDGYQAAGRLKASAAAWRWVAASNLAPAAHARVGLWARGRRGHRCGGDAGGAAETGR